MPAGAASRAMEAAPAAVAIRWADQVTGCLGFPADEPASDDEHEPAQAAAGRARAASQGRQEPPRQMPRITSHENDPRTNPKR